MEVTGPRSAGSLPPSHENIAVFDAHPIRRDGGGGPGEFAILFSDIAEDLYTRRDLASRDIRDRF